MVFKKSFFRVLNFNQRFQCILAYRQSSSTSFKNHSVFPLGRSDLATKDAIEISNNRNQLEIRVNFNPGNEDKTSNHILKFSPLWLRFNCHSNLSKQPESGQRIIDVESIPNDLTIESVECKENDNLIIKWNASSKQHDSVLPLRFLLSNFPSNTLPNINQSSRSKFKTPKALRTFDYNDFYDADGNKNNKIIFEWMKCIAEYGICMIKGVPLENRIVKKVAELIAPIQQTIYDEIFDVKAEKTPINIANTDAQLGFHMDLIYYESAPGLQFLHCLKFDDQIEGGSSLFVDSFEIAEQFREQFPDLFSNLVRIPATFQKIHMNRKRPVCMVYQKPHIVLNHNKQIMAVNWAPPFEGPLFNLSLEDINRYYMSYLKFSKFLNNHPNIIKHRLRPGELVCFNNRRLLHARDGFKSNNGERHLQGCYVNIDEFKSEALVQEFYSMLADESDINANSSRIDPRNLTLQRLIYGNNDSN